MDDLWCHFLNQSSRKWPCSSNDHVGSVCYHCQRGAESSNDVSRRIILFGLLQSKFLLLQLDIQLTRFQFETRYFPPTTIISSRIQKDLKIKHTASQLSAHTCDRKHRLLGSSYSRLRQAQARVLPASEQYPSKSGFIWHCHEVSPPRWCRAAWG